MAAPRDVLRYCAAEWDTAARTGQCGDPVGLADSWRFVSGSRATPLWTAPLLCFIVRPMISPFGLPPFDPSKMDPKVLMKLSQLVSQLPPSQVTRLQSLMHNMMAGFDVTKDLAEFEKELPPGFRENLLSILSEQAQAARQGEVLSDEMNVREARLTILRAVADGQMSPEEAEKLLFPSS